MPVLLEAGGVFKGLEGIMALLQAIGPAKRRVKRAGRSIFFMSHHLVDFVAGSLVGSRLLFPRNKR